MNLLENATLCLRKLGRWDEAEALAGEVVAIRREIMPDRWEYFAALSDLGESLLGQAKFSDAEPLLVDGYRGMQQRAETISVPARQRNLKPAAERLVKLYEAWNKPEEAANWAAELRSLEEDHP